MTRIRVFRLQRTRGLCGSSLRPFLHGALIAGLLSVPTWSGVQAQNQSLDDLWDMSQPWPGGSPPSFAEIFSFLSEDIAFQPYTGVLRGAQGTLMARAGNAEDQAVLLQSLLQQAGHESRLARCSLENEQATALLESVRAGDIGSINLAGFEEDGADLLTDQFAARVDLQYAVIEQAFLTTDVEIADNEKVGAAAELNLVRDHWWVQVSVGGRWRDLDPALALAPGTRACEAEQTFAEMPGERYHTVALTIASTVLGADDGLTETDNLTHTLRVADNPLAAPLLIFEPESGSAAETFAQGESTVFTPTLYIEGGSVLGTAIVLRPDGPRREGGAATIFDQFSQQLNPGGDEGGDAQPSGAELLSVRLIIETTGPDQTQRVERALYDRMGGGSSSAATLDRAALEPLQDDWTLPLRSIGIFGGAAPLHALADMRGGAIPETGVEEQGRLGVGFVTDLYRSMRAAVPGLVFDLDGTVSYANGANVLLVSMADAPVPPGEPLADENGNLYAPDLALALDYAIRSRRLHLTAEDAIGPAERVFDGVLDHEVERLVADLALFYEGSVPQAVLSVGTLIAEGVAEGSPAQIYLPGSDLPSADLGPMALTRIEEALGSQQAVILPTVTRLVDGVPRTGWWQVSLLDGTARDFMDDGTHSATSDNATLTARFLALIERVRRQGCKGVELLAVVTPFLAAGTDMPGLANGVSRAETACNVANALRRPRPSPGAGPTPPVPTPPGTGPYRMRNPPVVPPPRPHGPPRNRPSFNPANPANPTQGARPSSYPLRM